MVSRSGVLGTDVAPTKELGHFSSNLAFVAVPLKHNRVFLSFGRIKVCSPRRIIFRCPGETVNLTWVHSYKPLIRRQMILLP